MKPERKKHYAVLDHTWFHGLRPLCRERRLPTMVLTKEETTCRICLHFLKMRQEKFAQYVKGRTWHEEQQEGHRESAAGSQ